MRKNIFTLLTACAVMMTFAITGCGVGKTDSPVASNASKSTVFGVASLDTTATGTVSVKDSSVPAQEKTAAINSNGDYTVDMSGLTPPLILKAEGSDQAGNNQARYSLSINGGRANINPISDIAVAASADDTELSALYAMRSSDDYNRRTASNFERVINSLRTVLAPLFALYEVSGNGVTDDDDDDDDGDRDGDRDGDHDGDDDDDDNDSSGLRAMFRDVRFEVSRRTVTVTNRLTGAVIFSGSLYDLTSGTFYPENMPAGPGGSTACTYTYDAWGACQSDGTQTRNMLTSSPSGCVGTPVLSQACTYVPPTPTACTYTYGAWGACLSNGTQVRGLVSSVPAGCTGTPVLTQNCTYVPPAPTTCTSFTYSAWGACQPDNTRTRNLLTQSPAGCAGGAPITSEPCTYVPPTCTSFAYSAWGACQTNNTWTRTVVSSLPANCTGGTPVLSGTCTYVPPTCTSFTYSAWGACQPDNTRTRNLLTQSPAGCAGGTPITSEPCTYVPPAPPTCTSFTYSAWSACQPNNTRTRNLLTSSPSGCVGGTPVTSEPCTYVPPTPVCGSCHAIPPSSGRHSRHVTQLGYSCDRCHGAGYSSTTVNATTHNNSVINIINTLNWNTTTNTCGSPGCHGSRTW